MICVASVLCGVLWLLYVKWCVVATVLMYGHGAGEIPAIIGQLTNLRILRLDDNVLNGTLRLLVERLRQKMFALVLNMFPLGALCSRGISVSMCRLQSGLSCRYDA